MHELYPDFVLFDAWYNWSCNGYSTWKYFTDPYFQEQRMSLGDYPQNTKLYRYADLLLLAAEAAFRTGQTSDAVLWINEVRKRERNSGNTGYPLELSTLSIVDIWAERRVELAFEGYHFFDLIRTRRAAKIIKQDAMASEFAIAEHPEGMTIPQQFGDNFQTGKSEIMPIIQSAIDMSDGMLMQNPGY